MKKIFVFVVTIIFLACSTHDNKDETNDQSNKLHKVFNNSTFNKSFSKLMNDYYHLKDNFITENDSSINQFSRAMMKDVDSLQFAELKADSVIIEFAKTTAANVSGELDGLLGEKDLENKRKSFYTLSEQLYDLIKTVQYDRETIYHQYCQEVFDNSGATWLSNSAEIKNPYEPTKMLSCGKVTDRLDFRKK